MSRPANCTAPTVNDFINTIFAYTEAEFRRVKILRAMAESGSDEVMAHEEADISAWINVVHSREVYEYPKRLVHAQEPSKPRQVLGVAVGSIDGAPAAWGLLGDGSGGLTERLDLLVLIRAVGRSCLVVGIAHRMDGAWVHEIGEAGDLQVKGFRAFEEPEECWPDEISDWPP